MGDRANDWYRQAERDLGLVRTCITEQRHEWGCFAAHQAAGKAVKALHLAHGQEAWGHLVGQLLEELPVKVPAGLLDRAPRFARELTEHAMWVVVPPETADG